MKKLCLFLLVFCCVRMYCLQALQSSDKPKQGSGREFVISDKKPLGARRRASKNSLKEELGDCVRTMIDSSMQLAHQCGVVQAELSKKIASFATGDQDDNKQKSTTYKSILEQSATTQRSLGNITQATVKFQRALFRIAQGLIDNNRTFKKASRLSLHNAITVAERLKSSLSKEEKTFGRIVNDVKARDNAQHENLLKSFDHIKKSLLVHKTLWHNLNVQLAHDELLKNA